MQCYCTDTMCMAIAALIFTVCFIRMFYNYSSFINVESVSVESLTRRSSDPSSSLHKEVYRQVTTHIGCMNACTFAFIQKIYYTHVR